MTGASPVALLLLLLLLAPAAGDPKPSVPSVPSVLLFLADDLGWANVDWHAPRGAAFHATPRLDALRRAGVELDRLYTYKYCSPTRSALLSGRLPYHVNEGNGPITAPGAGIPAAFTTLSERLRDAGWLCHQIGVRPACAPRAPKPPRPAPGALQGSGTAASPRRP